MMSWLESIRSSSAARLVSSAAKEIFNESTSELEDPIADLRNSQSRIAELERLTDEYKAEIQHCRVKISELNFRIESLELQVLHNQEESDTILREKEDQIQGLIAQIYLRRGDPEGECATLRDSHLANPSKEFSLVTDEGFVQSGIITGQQLEKSGMLPTKLSTECQEIESLRQQLEQCREEKCQEVAALQESSAALVAHLKKRLCRLEQLNSGRDSSFLTESHSSVDRATQIETSPVKLFEKEVNTSEVDDNIESPESRFARISELLANAVAILPPPASTPLAVVWPPTQPEAQVAVLVAAEAVSRQELMMARAYIGQLQSIPSSSPLLTTKERTSHEAHTDPADASLDPPVEQIQSFAMHQQRSLARLAHVCKLLETTLISCIKFLRGECCLDEFDEDVNPLVEMGGRYAGMVEALKVAFDFTPLECSLKEICSQLEMHGKVITRVDGRSPTAIKLCELLSTRNDALRQFLLNGSGQVDEEDQTIAKKFSDLVKKSEHKDALCNALLCLLNNTESGLNSFDLNEYVLDANDLNIVKRLIDALFQKSITTPMDQLNEDMIQNIRNRIKLIDKNNVSPDLKSVLDCFDYLFAHMEQLQNDSVEWISTYSTPQRRISNDDVANDLTLSPTQTSSKGNEISTVLKMIKSMLNERKCHSTSGRFELTASGLSGEAKEIINCFNYLAEVDPESELRDYLLKVINLDESDPATLSPQNRFIAIKLADTLSHTHHPDSGVINFLNHLAEGLQNDALDELKEKIGSTDGDARLLDCLGRLVESFADLRTRCAEAEKAKAELSQLVRSKHAESQAYHAQLQKLLSEQSSVNANPSKDVAKLMAKIQRLELHLLQMEESHTREAVSAEEREASLREKLNLVETRFTALQEYVASADEQIGFVHKERDAAREACRTCQAELSALRLNHTNLQKALDSLQREMQVETNETAQHFRLENGQLQREVECLKQRIKDMQMEVIHLGDLEANNRVLHEQLERHASRLSEAHALARRYEERIQVLKNEMKELTDELDGKLDRSVMKSLLISCMKLPPAKRLEAFRSLGSVLHFTVEDYNLLGFNEPIAKNWRDLFWRSDAPNESNSAKPEPSFVELLANFLEKESAPPSQIRLPTDYLSSGVINAGGDVHGQRSRGSSAVQQRRRSAVSGAPPQKSNVSTNPLLSSLSNTKPPTI